MNIKSLLLGSAAALVAVTGARAADVIVPVAPDPVDYVRVCDVYGKGFFYIPGTETCLQIGGYVRFKYAVIGNRATLNDNGDDYSAGSAVRVRLNFDAREETELGTLRGFARVQATNAFGNNGVAGNSSFDQPYSMDMGYIQLGGLTMGYLDSLWTQEDGLFTDTDLPVGDIQVNRVSYTYAANGFSAAVSLEDDGSRDFAPDVVGLITYDAGFAKLYVAGSYDENNDFFGLTGPRRSGGFTSNGVPVFIDGNGNFVTGNGFVGGLTPGQSDGDGAFAIKGAITIKPFEDAQLKVEGSYAFDPSRYSTIGLFDTVRSIGNNNIGGSIPVEYQVGAGYQQAFGKLGLAASGVYGRTFDLSSFRANTVGAGVFPTFTRVDFGASDYYKLVGNVGYSITNNFSVLGEVSYTSIDTSVGEVDQTAGFVQFVRSF